MIKALKEVVCMNHYPQLSATELAKLICESSDIALLPSSNDYSWHTSNDLGSDYACDGEVITLGKARYANIKYCCGRFISSNNNIVESKDPSFLKTRYLFYFLSHTHKNYYVESTSYPKFDHNIFSNTKINIPSIKEQETRIENLDSINDLIDNETRQIINLESLIKSRFNEIGGSPC